MVFFDGVFGLCFVSLGIFVCLGDEIIIFDDVSVIKFDFIVLEIYFGGFEWGIMINVKSVVYFL